MYELFKAAPVDSAVAFLRLHEPEFVRMYMSSIEHQPSNFFKSLDEVEKYKLALGHISSILNYFSDVPLDYNYYRRVMISYYKRGATVQDAKQVVSDFVANFKREIMRLLNHNPKLAQQIAHQIENLRSDCFRQLDIAHIQFQAVA